MTLYYIYEHKKFDLITQHIYKFNNSTYLKTINKFKNN